MILLGALVLVLVGGALGALARWGVQEAWEHYADRRRGDRPRIRSVVGISWPTLLANVLACFLLGIVIPWVGSPSTPGAQLGFALVSTGFCGGMSTFSFFVLDIVNLLRRGAAVSAIGYLALTCGLSMAAFWLGLVIGL